MGENTPTNSPSLRTLKLPAITPPRDQSPSTIDEAIKKQAQFVEHSKQVLEQMQHYLLGQREKVAHDKEILANEKVQTEELLTQTRNRNCQELRDRAAGYVANLGELRAKPLVDPSATAGITTALTSLRADQKALRTQFESEIADFLRETRNIQQILHLRVAGTSARESLDALRSRVSALQREMGQRCLAKAALDQRPVLGLAPAEAAEFPPPPKPVFATAATEACASPVVLSPSPFLTKWFLDNESILHE
jgi:hypothetical protein